MTPTKQQQDIIDAALAGEVIKIGALAGTGKTTTLGLIAKALPGKRILAVAFNKTIVGELERKMPSNVEARTAHSLAYRAVGKKYRPRLDARPTLRDSARALNLSGGVAIGERVLSEPVLARLAVDTVTNLCRTTQTEVKGYMVPVLAGLDDLDSKGKPMKGDNHERLIDVVLPLAEAAWDDIQRVNGVLRFSHDNYLKIWADSQPHLDYDIILFDEAQDADPVIAAVVDAQRDHALVYPVGDSNQAIYEWRGAVDALANFDGRELRLTESWRFGPEVSEVANHYLGLLGSDMRVVGNGPAGFVGPIEEPDAILCRTNSGVIDALLDSLAKGRRAHIVKGTSDLEAFCKAAADLMQGRDTLYPDLTAFRSWGEVQDYVRDDPNGADLAVQVRLIDKHGVYTILDALKKCTYKEEQADVVISTAHKAKGREWDSVKISWDFEIQNKDKNNPPPPPSTADLRLRYVAVTRAMKALDPGPLAIPTAADIAA